MRLQQGLLCLPAHSQEHAGNTRRLALTTRRAAAEPVSALPARRNRMSTSKALWNHLQQAWCACFWHVVTPWGWYKGLTSSSGICVYSTALYSLLGIHERTPQMTGLPLAPCSPHRCSAGHTEHMWQAGKRLEMFAKEGEIWACLAFASLTQILSHSFVTNWLTLINNTPPPEVNRLIIRLLCYDDKMFH